MTTSELINNINLMMGENYDDDLLSAYVAQAQQACVDWEYALIGTPDPEDITLSKYDTVVVEAVIAGLSIRGAENETQHSENGILRGFKHSSMTDYIRSHLVPYARVI